MTFTKQVLSGELFTKRKSLQSQETFTVIPKKESLEFFAMKNLGSLPKALQKNQYMLVLTERYSNLTRALPTSKSAASHIVDLFLDSCIVSFRIAAYLLTDQTMHVDTTFFVAHHWRIQQTNRIHITMVVRCSFQRRSQLPMLVSRFTTRRSYMIGFLPSKNIVLIQRPYKQSMCPDL